ncbi:hypothetical protein WMF31_27060 [Sorangium sp. So ce1036]|uniref:hypothetical protein n=1 Tax=Sorangium sp. So ce1036 TaxID=3133328 RepID=UPI003F0B4D0C
MVFRLRRIDFSSDARASILTIVAVDHLGGDVARARSVRITDCWDPPRVVDLAVTWSVGAQWA